MVAGNNLWAEFVLNHEPNSYPWRLDMKTRILQSSIAVIVLALLFPVSAFADGIIIPEPPICEPFPCPYIRPMVQLAITYHRVEIEIIDQVAITRVDQVFRNENDWTVEGTYLFSLRNT
jgi:hypothetical protein